MSRDTIAEAFEHAGMQVEIHYDSDPESPREWDNAGTMVCWHSRYNLGDGVCNGKCIGTGKDGLTFASPEEFQEWWKANGKGGVILPLWLYDHSGISMSCGNRSYPYDDQWDSGQVGWIFATADTIRKEWGKGKSKRITKGMRELAEKCLRQEVETYDEYLTGQVYCYDVREMVTDDNGDETELNVESCCGFYGLEYCIEEAKGMAECMRRHADEREAPGNHLAESI